MASNNQRPQTFTPPTITLSELMRRTAPAQPAPLPEPDEPTYIGGGLRAGANVAHAMFAGAGAAAARAVGADETANWAEGAMLRNLAEAQQYGRPDLETAPWREGGSPAIPWFIYQTAKQVPQWAPALAAGMVTGGTGAAALAGVSAAAQGAGSMYEAARADDGTVTAEEARKALALSPLYGAAEAAVPFALGKIGGRTAGTAIAKFLGSKSKTSQVLRGIGGAAAGEGATEGVQTGMELSFRKDMTAPQKSREIIDAMLTGGILGGGMSVPFTVTTPVRQIQDTTAGDVTNDQLIAAVEQTVPTEPPSVDARGQAVMQGMAPPQEIVDAPQDIETMAPRPFAGASVAQLTEQLNGLDQAAAADTLSAQMAQDRESIQHELQLRDQELAQGRPLAAEDTASLQQALNAARDRIIQSPTQADVQLVRALEQEVALREQYMAPAADERQGQLFDDLPEQLTGKALQDRIISDEQAEERASKVREQARKLAGGKSKFIDSLQAKSGLELAVAVHDQLGREDGTKQGITKTTYALAQRLGVLDKDGLSVVERDPRQAVVEAQRKVDKATQRFKAMDGRAQEVKQLEQARQELAQAEAQSTMAQRLKDYLQSRDAGSVVATDTAGLTPTITKVPARQEVVVSPEAGVAPEFKTMGQSYDITLPDGGVVNVVYDRSGAGKNHGWKFPSGARVQLAEGERGIKGAAAAVVRQAAEGTLPEGVKIGEGINDPTSPGNKYRRGEAGDVATVAVGDVQTDVAQALGQWDTPPNVMVIRSTADLPTSVAESVLKDSAEDATGMVTPDGQIYLFTDNMTSREEGMATLYHEALGHAGLNKQFRQKLDDTMVQMYRSNKKLKREADQWTQQYPDAYPGKQQTARAVEEVLAARSEAGQMDATMFAKLSRVVKQFLRRMGLKLAMSDAEVDVVLAMAHKAAFGPEVGGGTRYRRNTRASAVRTPETIRGTNEALKDFSGKAGQVLQHVRGLSWDTVSPTVRTTALKWTTGQHHLEMYGQLFDGALDDLINAKTQRTTVTNLLEQQNLKPLEALRTLDRSNAEAAKKVMKLMGMTFYRINPTKSWAEHTWLHGHQDAAKLKQHHADARRMFSSLKQSGNAQVYTNLIAMNKAMYTAQYTMLMQSLLVSYMGEKATWTDPMTVYQHSSRFHRNAQLTEKFWEHELDTMKKRVQQASEATAREAKEATPSDARGMMGRVATFSELIQKVDENIKHIDDAPYFHLGRYGDYYVSFHLPIVKNADGKMVYDDAKLEAVRTKLSEAGFEGVELPDVVMGGTGAYVRVESQRAARELHSVLEALGDQDVYDIRSGKLSNTGISPGRDMSRWADLVDRELAVREGEAIDRATTDEEAKQATKYYERVRSQLKDMTLDLMPDIASAKVMSQRKSVSGFSANHMQSYAYRARVASHALANLTANHKIQQAFEDMDIKINDAKSDADDRAFVMQDVLREHELREAQRATQPERSWVDTVRAWNHTYFLGLSPAYLLTNLTQVPVLLLPELGKRHGYVKSSKAIGAVTGDAFKIVNAAFRGGGEEGRGLLQSIEDPLITIETLQRAGITGKKAERVMRMVNTGIIDIGSASREMGRIEENRLDKPQDRMLRVAGSFGLYSEMVTRLIAALSAYDLSDKSGLRGPAQEDYVARVVNQSMLNYTTDNTARMAGRQGFIGKASPLPLAFMQYSMQLMEKLFREAYVGFFDGGANPELKAEARKFLLGHATVIGMLSGTLGLPGASLVAHLISTMTNWFGDDEEPYDAVAAYRNFLADVFGQDAAEIIARGVPRAVNVDMSIRAGEQNLIPFTQFLTDKREWREKISAATTRFGGSPLSLVMNLLEGGSLVAKGDYIEGMKKAVPVALKGPIEAGRMSAQGYLDKNGNELPMDADVRDIFVQFFGFSPSEKAEYSEANFAQIVRDTQLRRKAQGIRKNLLIALERGDATEFQRWLERAMDFDADNPAYDILPGLDTAFKRRKAAQAEAAAMSLPLRGNVRDPGSISLTRYANFGLKG